jgi:RNA polymerase sigma factor for flagellar operon FliA
LQTAVSDYKKIERKQPSPVCEAGPLSPIDREALILKHGRLVKFVAQRLFRRLPNHIALEDLISVGMIGLMDAIQKYDPGKMVNFSTYAEYRVRGAMLDELRAMDWVPRSVRKIKTLLEYTVRELERAKGAPVEDEEVAKKLGKTLEAFYHLVTAACGVTAQPLKMTSYPSDSDTPSDTHDRKLQALPADERQDPAFQVILRDQKKNLARAIDRLTQREKTFLSLYYYEELSGRKIGRILNCSEGRVSQIHSEVRSKLRAKLT